MTKRFGFTLAEVLITLGIIGVVAAMTIPTLMVDINTRQWSTAKNVFNKKLNEAMKSMNTAQVISGHTTTLSFVNELGKHFKINKICKNDDLQSCFPDTVWWGAGEATPVEVDMTTINQASHFGLEDWGTELIGVQFANGVTGLVAYNPKCSGDPYSNQFEGSKCISMLYDVSGNKNPNTSGKDLGNYGTINQLGRAACAFEVNGTCYGAPFIPTPVMPDECDEFYSEFGVPCRAVQEDEEEPIPDYWGGAVKACGGNSKLPTAAQLAEIANYLYETNEITSDSYNGDIELNLEKAANLGFNTDDWFIIWGNGESQSVYGALHRSFGPDTTNSFYTGRDNSRGYAVCIK